MPSLGRPTVLGRSTILPVPLIGRQSPIVGNTSGRQSPLLLSKVPYSPVNRRTRKLAAKTPQMRKSLSLDNVTSDLEPGVKLPRNEYFPEKIEENEDLPHNPEFAASSVSEGVSSFNSPELCPDTEPVRFEEVCGRASTSYSSLPRPVSRSKSITRSLVPKMRRMFEKSRSCDPDLSEESSAVPEPRNRYLAPDNGRDGTESTRSSFVLLDPGTRSGSSLTVEDLDRISSDRKSKGFVNKCVTKVKSLMGKSEERE